VDPISIEVTDSIIDAAYGLPAIYSNCGAPAHADLTVERSTILGDLCVQQMTRAEDSLFVGIVHVQRRGLGYMRFCYVPNSFNEMPPLSGTAHLRRALSIAFAVHDTTSTLLRMETHDLSGAEWYYKIRTPPQFKCVPGLKSSRTSQDCTTGCGDSPAASSVTERKPMPTFVSTEYGHPGYCELSQDCDLRILQGSEDQSEFGVFHDLYRPQRGAALQSRLQEYTPADMQSSVIYADDLHPSQFGGPH
jgi:hypothetical protein